MCQNNIKTKNTHFSSMIMSAYIGLNGYYIQVDRLPLEFANLSNVVVAMVSIKSASLRALANSANLLIVASIHLLVVCQHIILYIHLCTHSAITPVTDVSLWHYGIDENNIILFTDKSECCILLKNKSFILNV